VVAPAPTFTRSISTCLPPCAWTGVVSDGPPGETRHTAIIHDLVTPGHAQFLIASHSPMILSYPGAVLFSLDGDTIQEVDHRETNHYLITRDFLNSPERFFKHLFDDEAMDKL
jgi:hypothetical protein